MTARGKKSTDQGTSFEQSLEELESLIERMEEGDLSLEESLKTYERGIVLSRTCQKALDDAEQRIQILTERDGKSELEALQPDDGREERPDDG